MTDKREHIAELCGELESTMRLRTTPVGVRRVADKKEIEGIKGWKTIDYVHSGCQYINMARSIGWAFVLELETLHFCGFTWSAGIGEDPGEGRSDRVVGTWFNNVEAAKKWLKAYPRIPGKIEAMLMAPVNRQMFEPEVIWIYGTPAQMILIINGYQHATYARMQFSCLGESSCMDALHQAYVSGKPSVNIPCFGERWFGGTHEEELSMGIPAQELERIVQGMRDLRKIGYRYPIPTLASEANTHSDICLNRMYGEGKRDERARTGKSFWD